MSTFVYHENPSNDKAFVKSGDAYAIDEDVKAYAVADSPLRCIIRDSKQYPHDYHSDKAAQLFCDSFVESTKKLIKGSSRSKGNDKDKDNDNDKDGFTIEKFITVLNVANKSIADLNKKLDLTYDNPLKYDLAETVGVGALIQGNKLFYGGLDDCAIRVLRGTQLKNVAKWDQPVKRSSKYIDRLAESGELMNYYTPEFHELVKKENYWEPCWCNHLRNNIDAKDREGKLVGWGCFTGESKASDFYQVHELTLEKGDHIFIYSDGMEKYIKNAGFTKWFLKNVTNSFYFHMELRKTIIALQNLISDVDKEKTLIYIKY